MFFNKKLKAQIRCLEANQKALEGTLAWAKAQNVRLTNRIRTYDLASQPMQAKRLTGIKFKALFDGRYQVTQFSIGPGPCGKTVKYFTTECADGLLRIYQWHTDGSHKEFVYRLSDIDGRIQYDYELVTLEGDEARAEQKSRWVQVQVFPRMA